MARLTQEQWAEARASCEVRNKSNTEIAEDFGITEGAVRKRGKKEGWIRGISTGLIEEKVNIINNVKNFSEKSTELSTNHLNAIDDEVRFKLQNDKDLQAIQNKVNLMVDEIDNPNHALALMNATVKHREARLGKSPDTAIQINTNSPAKVSADMSPQDAARAYQDLMNGK